MRRMWHSVPANFGKDARPVGPPVEYNSPCKATGGYRSRGEQNVKRSQVVSVMESTD